MEWFWGLLHNSWDPAAPWYRPIIAPQHKLDLRLISVVCFGFSGTFFPSLHSLGGKWILGGANTKKGNQNQRYYVRILAEMDHFPSVSANDSCRLWIQKCLWKNILNVLNAGERKITSEWQINMDTEEWISCRSTAIQISCSCIACCWNLIALVSG